MATCGNKHWIDPSYRLDLSGLLRWVLLWLLISLLISLLICGPAVGQPALTATDRRALLDATRPQAALRAGQPVKFKVERLNVDGDWALLTGELVSTTGKPLSWRKAQECYLELDKMLWVVLRRQAGRWRVQHLEVCATEPPHWSVDQFGGLVWPCGVYAGLQGPTGEDLQAACRNKPAAQSKRP
jgi:hypothetical protein